MKKHSLIFIALLAAGCSAPASFTDNSVDRKADPLPAVPPESADGQPVELPTPPTPYKLQVADGAVVPVSLELRSETQELHQTFRLQKKAPRTRIFTQVERPSAFEHFEQGKPGQLTTDRLGVVASRKLDLMVVVDDSPGAGLYQERLKTALRPLVAELDVADWQIGFITMSNSCLLDVITRSDWHRDAASTERRFADAVLIGERGGATPRGVEMAIRGMAGECLGNARPWLRPGSVTIVMFVTPQQNCMATDGSNCQAQGVPYFGPDEFLKAAPAGTRAFALLRTDRACGTSAAYQEPSDYLRILDQTGGSYGVLCQADYGQALAGISTQVASEVRREFHLQHAPDADSVALFVDGRRFDTAFQIDGSKLVLTGNPLPRPDASLDVQYTYSGRARWQETKLAKPASPESLVVKVDGQELDPADYSYDAAADMLRLAAMPADGVSVDVSYRVNEPLPQSFSVGENLVPLSTSVYVDDQSVPAGDLSVAADTVTLAVPPPDHAKVRVVYNAESDYVTRYHSTVADPSIVSAFSLVDAETGETLDGRLEGDQIVCPLALVESQRLVDAIFQARQPSVVLPQDAVEDSVKIASASNRKDCAPTYDGDTRRVTYACPDGAIPDLVQVSYDHVSDFTREITATGAPTGDAAWRVWIDGRSTEAFTREGLVLTITDDRLVPGSVVTIEVLPLAP